MTKDPNPPVWTARIFRTLHHHYNSPIDRGFRPTLSEEETEEAAIMLLGDLFDHFKDDGKALRLINAGLADAGIDATAAPTPPPVTETPK